MKKISISPEEEKLFRMAQRGNYTPFLEYYFGMKFSGTWYTPQDRQGQYFLMLEVWDAFGRPDHEFEAVIEDGRPEKLLVVWDPYYEGKPIFLLQHGFRLLPWIERYVAPTVSKAAVTTGTGSGKTACVGVMALAYCATIPGFRFLNGGPTQHQSDLMLGEVIKWAANAPFEKFIVKSRGTNPLWLVDPYPTVRIISPIDPDVTSTFVCQTIKRDANNILGGERDWINVDEAQLVANIEVAEPRLVTRMRGTRENGLPRWTKLTWMSNPGDAPEFVALIEKYAALQEEDPDSVWVKENIPSSANIYITKRQLAEMQRSLTESQKERWLSGSMSAVLTGGEIPQHLLENCRDHELEEYLQSARIGRYSEDFGLMEYELPYDRTGEYLLVGDVGKSPLYTMNSMNVPCLMVFDVRDFPETSRLVAFCWIEKAKSYEQFTDKLEYFMMKYRCRGYYDAGNIQSAFEDVGPFKDIPFTEEVYFSGISGVKQWAIAAVVLLMQHGAFRWPKIDGLWYQARNFDITSKKKPDDIVMCLLIFARVLAMEGTLWSKFTENFGWEWDEIENDLEEAPGLISDDWPMEDERPIPLDRYSRVLA